MQKLTQEKVRRLFNYRNGTLVWKVTKNNNSAKMGSVAGSISNNGYYMVSFDNKRYFTHKIIWLWHKGYIPEKHIDHRNQDRLDNHIQNLREVSRSCNLRNYENRKDNKSGVRGVHWYKPTKKWQARITSNNKRFSLGYYNDFNEAVLARLAGEQRLSWYKCNQCSSAYKYALKNKLIEDRKDEWQ